MKRNFKWMLVAILTICGAINVYAENVPVRISNPEFGSGVLDGFITGGVHDNDYTTCMAARGEEVYIATARNLGRGWVNIFTPKCDFWGIFGDVVQGIYPRDDSNDGGKIIAYNSKDGSFKVIYPNDEIGSKTTVSFRSAITFGNDVYFGAFSADPAVSPYILKLDKDGKFTKVFETRDCHALRASCEYDGHLFFAGADEREEVTGNVAKLAVLRMNVADGKTEWNRVADYKDFGDVAYDEIFNVWADAPIWSLASHNGYLYATLPSSEGFVVFRGHQAVTGEEPNRYGWYWEEVAGKKNGKNNPGLSDVTGGEPGTLTLLSGSVYEFNGKLYAYNFDHSIFGELSVFMGGLKSQTEQPSSTALDYLNFLYKIMNNPQKVWCLNDATGKFELQDNFTQNMLGTLTGRVGEYDGQLYVSTIDPGHIYILLSQIAAGGFLEMTPSEIISKLTSLSQTLNLLKKSKQLKAEDQTLIDKLELLQTLLSQFLVCDIVNASSIYDILSQADLLNLNNLINSLTSDPSVTISWDYQNLLDLIVQLIKDKLLGNTITIPDNTIPDLTNLVDYKTLLEDIVKLIQDRLSGGSGVVPDIPGITDLLNLLLERLNGTTTTTPDYTDLTALLELLLQRLGNASSTPDYTSLLELIQQLLGNVGNNPDFKTLLELIQAALTGNTGTGSTPDWTALLDFIQAALNGNTGTSGNILRDLILGGLLGNLLDNIQGLINGFNTGALSDYAYLYNRMRANKMGCDIMRTADGETFEFVTRDGLGDKYNYGCCAFAASDDGLYIGTSNSFYGGQLWLLPKTSTPGSWVGPETDNADAIQNIAGAAIQSGYYTLDGRRVNGKPAQKGIYIYNGKKISIK